MSFRFSFFILVMGLSYPLGGADARPLKVVVSLPPLAWLVQKVGGSEVQVDSLLRGTEDPHYVDALPSFVSKVSQADALCFIGMDLEDAWLPKVVERSGNSRLQKGGSGYCNLGSAVQVLNRPDSTVDRSHGHIHGMGNPHWYLSLSSLAEASTQIVELLSRLRPERTSYFNRNQADLRLKVEKEIKSLKAQAPRKLKVMEYHQEFSYVLRDLGISSLGSVEEIPGVPPSAAGISRVRKKMEQDAVEIVLATKAQPARVLNSVTADTSAQVIQIDPMPHLALDPIEYNRLLIQQMAHAHQRGMKR